MGPRPLITLPFPPSGNRYWRIWRGRAVASPEAVAYKETVRLLCLTRGMKLIEGDVHVHLWLYRRARRGDLDNSLKVLLDALQGVAYQNDSAIREIHAVQFEDAADPRVRVIVEPWRLDATTAKRLGVSVA